MCRKSIQIMWLVITYNKVASFGQDEDEAKFHFFLSHCKFYRWKFIFHLLKLFCYRKPCRTFGSFKEESNFYKLYSFFKNSHFCNTHYYKVKILFSLFLYPPSLALWTHSLAKANLKLVFHCSSCLGLLCTWTFESQHQ